MKLILRMGLVAAVVAAQCGVAQTVKVGTFDRPSIVVAFYRSPMWSAVVQEKKTEMQQAKAANDQKKVEELNKWGGDSQETGAPAVGGRGADRQHTGDDETDVCDRCGAGACGVHCA